MSKATQLRRQLLRSGFSEEATEMYVYIDQVTKGGKKGAEAFERKSLADKVQLAILSRFGVLQPHIGNIEKLYDDPAHRQEWVGRYQRRFGN